jgi:hypothetical protein
MIEDIEELCIQTEEDVLSDWNFLREEDLGIRKVRSSKLVAPRVAELTVRRRVPASAGSGTWIDNRSECIGVEPLPGPLPASHLRWVFCDKAAHQQHGSRVVFPLPVEIAECRCSFIPLPL